MNEPWYIAVKPFDPASGDAWKKYIEFSKLHQIKQLISFDNCLCPCVLSELNEGDWQYNVKEDYLIFFFKDIDYLLDRIAHIRPVNLLAAIKNPQKECCDLLSDPRFAFCGYDIVDIHCDISALTNCGGFPKAFSNEELNESGLITTYTHADQINQALQQHYPDESHADCNIWALWKINTSA